MLIKVPLWCIWKVRGRKGNYEPFGAEKCNANVARYWQDKFEIVSLTFTLLWNQPNNTLVLGVDEGNYVVNLIFSHNLNCLV
jgi:hypothetical protein